MNKALFLLCPTDCLESIINKAFRCENYFYSSLGNSFNIDFTMLKNIKELVEKHNIKEIYFVLADDNKIVLDALRGEFFSKIRGLKKLYKEIESQKKHSEVLWKNEDNQFSILSYYLNKKIKELNGLFNQQVKINGKVYDKRSNVFKDIYSDLVCIDKYQLN